jgi:hypothetical protein
LSAMEMDIIHFMLMRHLCSFCYTYFMFLHDSSRGSIVLAYVAYCSSLHNISLEGDIPIDDLSDTAED